LAFFYKEKIKEGMLMMKGLCTSGLPGSSPRLSTRGDLWRNAGKVGGGRHRDIKIPLKQYVTNTLL
jgi:hypothetical protein